MDLEKLKELKELLDTGAIDQEEFEKLKKEALSAVSETKPENKQKVHKSWDPIGDYKAFFTGPWDFKKFLAVAIVIGIIIYIVKFSGPPRGNGDVEQWKTYIDYQKTELCDCVAEARSIRNTEKSSRNQDRCIYEFRLVLNDIEDDNKLSDDEFNTVNRYIQGKFNESCN